MDGLFLDDAGFSAGGRVILHPLTLALTERRIGILGRNGSGKTTLMRLIAGLVAPTSGRVRVDGIDPAGDRRGLIARLGILFQNPDHQILFPTVAEEIAFGLTQQGHPDPKGAASAALAAHGRAHWAGAATHTLSQGQRQYLCLMAVLAMAPATLLLDEPFAGLDLPTQARLGVLLAGLPQRTVVISHDPAHLARADRVLWLEAGRLAMDGQPGTVIPAYLSAMERAAGDADTDLPL
jgi:biotin transport system ATP-binding protein